METAVTFQGEHDPIPAAVPGSVQGALRAAGILPDWNAGLNARLCEWVENRHWIYQADIPDGWLSDGASVRLNALGLDYSGWVFVNGHEAGSFRGTFVPHVFDLTPFLDPNGNVLSIVFDCPPRWLGQTGYTSRMTEWKERFNYTWDWTARLVQIGVWDDLLLEIVDGPELGEVRCTTGISETGGTLRLRADAPQGDGLTARVSLCHDGGTVFEAEVSALSLRQGLEWTGLVVDRWWPNGAGAQLLYTLRVELRDGAGRAVDTDTRRVGFRSVEWLPCEGAPEDADPWLCVVNGRPIFLWGVNWTPIRPNFADVGDEEYRTRLETYQSLGMNVLRVWGGACLEKQVFYDTCDELGLLVWQEFPLSSSGLENWPPEDADAIEALSDIARSYIVRRQSHPSLLLWCGGNELQGTLDGGKEGCGKPCGLDHPLLRRLGEIVASLDPERRYLPASSSGPRFTADENEFGAGVHWDVHGPWLPDGPLDGSWARYWQNDDALFRSETGAPGASPVDIIRAFRGDLEELPGTAANPLWRRSSWWIEWPYCSTELGCEPDTLEQYVAWSQERQRTALTVAARATKDRFPQCGGLILWMGHDSFPCTANTAILDFYGRPKPAAIALGEIFRAE
jgi:beta-mannosidase